MKQTKYLLFACVSILIVLVTESNAKGNGCSWSGCVLFLGGSSVCATAATGGSGRPIRYLTSKCQTFGKKDFCCDGDCGWQKCGMNCKFLNMKSYSEIAGIPCLFEIPIPGYPPIATTRPFCCP